MISVIYAVVSALLIVWLSFRVIKLRRKNRISIGDGRNSELKIAIAAQSNAIEYIPIALLLLFALEYNNANIFLVHILGLMLITGRIVHARGILSEKLNIRVVGMQITIFSIIGLSISNLLYLPYEKLFSFWS